MIVEVKRFELGDKYTIGTMSIDGIFFCYTLEDKVRPNGEKIAGKTAIPEGKYKLIIDRSTRFGRDMPHILNVPNFEGVRIHSGNTDLDTEGCILIGLDWVKGNFISRSKDAFNAFFPKLQNAKQAEIIICH